MPASLRQVATSEGGAADVASRRTADSKGAGLHGAVAAVGAAVGGVRPLAAATRSTSESPIWTVG